MSGYLCEQSVNVCLNENTHCCRPVSLKGLLDIKAKHNAAKLVVGNTEVGIELKFKHAGYPVLVGTTHVPELNSIEVSSVPQSASLSPYHTCEWRDTRRALICS